MDEKDTKMGFTDEDLPGVNKLLRSQQTFLPSSKEKNYTLIPSILNQYRSQEMKKQVEENLTDMNKSLKASQMRRLIWKTEKLSFLKALTVSSMM